METLLAPSQRQPPAHVPGQAAPVAGSGPGGLCPAGTHHLLHFPEKEKPWDVFPSLLLTCGTVGAEGSQELPQLFIRSSGTQTAAVLHTGFNSSKPKS